MPTGGYELAYNPSWWYGYYQYRANCYCYALNFCTYSIYLIDQQPGVKGYSPYTSLTASSIIYATSEDILYLSNLLGIDSSSTYETPGTNEYKVALVIDPSHDYHWYRQNPDGSWSHKPGHTEVINTDASGNVIYCPETCNRNYGGVNYSVFCGYYMISYYSSATLTNQ